VVPKFEAAARSLIADGADVIVGACGNFAAFPYHGYVKVAGTEVPVLDPLMCGTFMAKMMGELHRTIVVSTSKALAFKGVPKELAARVVAPFAIAS
jgi:hypothetical protein